MVASTLNSLARHAYPQMDHRTLDAVAQAISAGYRVYPRWRRGWAVLAVDDGP
jgi:hypothetical protein